ncbi:MAG: dienelactone hydrolase family protein [Clostridia bacterium]|nr:dienelactone hydrolase family protein [Clostridia bacterium]
MSTILTPLSLWKNFDCSLDCNAQTLSEKSEDGIKFERLNFYGRRTAKGRVKVYAVFACSESAPAESTILLFPESSATVDEELLKLFVKNGYSVLMPDYRGKVDGLDNYTVYPEDVAYANYFQAGRHKDFVDDDAAHTSWYEWVGVARYAYKYLEERNGVGRIGAAGIRDGGDIVWQLITMVDAACAVTVCSVGWKAYSGYSKFSTAEPALDGERYRYIAGVDSQAYAPFVRCPVLMLCSTNDAHFDYDRAYDTFSRINEQYADLSVIAYSVHCGGGISVGSTRDMFMFFDKFVKQRHVFLPKPAEITVLADEQQNLVAQVIIDKNGEVEDTGFYLAEDCIDSSLREWTSAQMKGKPADGAYQYYLDIYEKTSLIFALCYVTYTNGFTVWSKIVAKKVKGTFKNMCKKSRILYSSNDGNESFSVADCSSYAVGGVFFTDSLALPKLVKKDGGLKGLYSECGLMTMRSNDLRYSAPEPKSILKLDVYCDKASKVTFCMQDMKSGDVYTTVFDAVGGLWQGVLLDCKNFKTKQGASLPGYDEKLKFVINCDGPYAVNNIMWL